MTDTEIDKLARQLYISETSNHPTIHCNRFPAWSELSEESKNSLRGRVLTDKK